MINQTLEIARWVGVSLAIFCALQWGRDGVDRFSLFSVASVFFLAGLTGVESVFFGKTARGQSGYGGDHGGVTGGYQRQSGLNNIALALVMLWAWVRGWSVEALLAVFMVMMVFLILSAANHAYSAWREGNTSRKNLLRPFGVLALWGQAFRFCGGCCQLINQSNSDLDCL